MTENSLVRKIKSGDKSGLDELVAQFYPAILKYCLWHTDTRETAEDATQQTFVNFFEHFYQYDHQGKLKSYLYSIARNICINHSKRNQTVELPDELLYEEGGYKNVDSCIDMNLLIAPLTIEQKELVLLKYAHDLKLREISEITGLPMRTVQTRLRAAMKRLKKTINAGGHDE